LPLIRFKAKRSYTAADLKGALGLDFTSGLHDRAMTSDAPNIGGMEGSISAPTDQQTGESICPRCYAPMVKKRVRSGKHSGTEVMACSRYPKCRMLLPFNGHGESSSVVSLSMSEG
jgi:hypothetical protein